MTSTPKSELGLDDDEEEEERAGVAPSRFLRILLFVDVTVVAVDREGTTLPYPALLGAGGATPIKAEELDPEA